MDKDEYRAYRETVIRRRQQEEDRKQAKDAVYDPRRMNVGRMPLGCWIWIGIVAAIILGLLGIIKIFH